MSQKVCFFYLTATIILIRTKIIDYDRVGT
jgi:hypothetical protein